MTFAGTKRPEARIEAGPSQELRRLGQKLTKVARLERRFEEKPTEAEVRGEVLEVSDVSSTKAQMTGAPADNELIVSIAGLGPSPGRWAEGRGPSAVMAINRIGFFC